MKFGYDLFKINYSSPAELEGVEQEIRNLEDVWKTKADWDTQWEETKLIKFKEFDHETLDDMADEY
jgi:ATP-dependent phosphoenolpyruvate carboxykinase